ncbi:hypothetical protein [Sphingosinicella sp. BN140058]|uniref:hypothetical protein n=1 Tax=Sphingosinicella sp. BN140058 TaxID=1892855 RepID=UPI0010119148|nr:hypothetical protein [Sphingosinicella sp. BN140058]QAY78438.1 hypothetical protein ETR14_19265 [Sphingosinicella sp. BN140058]
MDRTDTPTRLDAGLLAQAFPAALRTEALAAGEAIMARLHRDYPTRRYPVRVAGEEILIPDRLHLRSTFGVSALAGTPRLMTRCLETRSLDGYQRQRAVREVLDDIQTWAVPFVIELIGSYVVEILSDIHAALTPKKIATIVPFLAANPGYWRCIRAQVMSYWDVYYRNVPRSEYVGFTLVALLDKAAQPALGSLPPMHGRRSRCISRAKARRIRSRDLEI